MGGVQRYSDPPILKNGGIGPLVPPGFEAPALIYWIRRESARVFTAKSSIRANSLLIGSVGGKLTHQSTSWHKLASHSN